MKPPAVALRVLRSAPVTWLARSLTRSRLRILAYHGVPDADRFEAQMRYLAANYVPVDEAAVIAAYRHGASLPEGAAWVTFDDGDPSVVELGLPALVRWNVPATMFVCPGLIESGEPFWWRLSDWAAAHPDEAPPTPAGPAGLTEYAKTIPDPDRRTLIAEVSGRVPRPFPPQWRQLDRAQLRRWLDAGMALGNHSWDHPCLDRCRPEAQIDQLRRAHCWLESLLGSPPRTFAYPNGNFSDVVDRVVAELGYDLAVLYDNRLTGTDAPRLQLSRVMLEADQPVERLVGVLSGAQPALSRLSGRH